MYKIYIIHNDVGMLLSFPAAPSTMFIIDEEFII